MLHQTIDTAETFAANRAADCTKDMGATPVEFVRQLKNLAPEGDIRVDETQGKARVVHAGGMVTIDFQPEADRKIGALTIPVTGVDIRFQDITVAEAANFLAAWDRNFLRMGG